MLLIGVREEKGWLLSEWRLSYRGSWAQLCEAVYVMYDFYDVTEILVGDKKVDIKDKKEIKKLPEDISLTIRGMSGILNVPVSITFYNQTRAVYANVAGATEEFKEADYQKFNMSMSEYMDSIEIAMHAKNE